MDEQQLRIHDDLTGLFSGELRFDDVAQELYSTDASLYQIRPLGVAFPRHHDDVVTLAQYARDNGVPLIARGAGSGLAGGALGRGIVIDFSRHLNQIEHIDADTVRVQTGVVRHQLNLELRKQGRYFPPDPSSSAVTTVGGMLAVDAAGSHAVSVGSTRDHVKSIEAVLADGHRVEAGLVSRHPDRNDQSRLSRLSSELAHLISRNEGLIRERQPALPRNCSGYHLRTVIQSDGINLPRLLVGSEGTLALFTAATLYTSPLPADRGAALVLFRNLETALEAIQAIIPLQPSACDLLDRRLLSLIRDADSRIAPLIPSSAEAALLIEQSGYSDQQMNQRLQEVLQVIQETDPSARIPVEARSPADVEFLWSLPQRVVPLLNELQGETRPLPLVEDIAVPPEMLREFLRKAQRVFQKHWITASLYAHAASGQLHFRPFMPMPTPATATQVESLARELYEAALACGGTVSGEHGNGLARTAFIRSQYGPMYRLFQQVKDLFDPHNLLNPGKIISDDPHLTIRNLRTQPSTAPEKNSLVPLQLQWAAGELQETTVRCNGCGDCRVQGQHIRMCPFFHVDQFEAASPRAKANLMRGLAGQQLDDRTFSTEEAKEVADLCFNCKQCLLECPSSVNVPALAIEAKAQCVAANGLSRADYLLSRAHSFGPWGCRFAPLANWATTNTGIRWLIEKVLGISQHRRLPRFARREFLKTIPGRKQKPSKADAVYFVDHFVNYHDHELGWAFLRIMKHHGVDVTVPREQVSSGMAMVSAGDLDAAREVAERNVRILAEHVREGQPIICTEPTAAVCLKYEYPRLLSHPDVALVAEQTVEAGEYLWSLHEEGQLKTRFSHVPLELGYHTPCHVRFLRAESALAQLMELIPGVTLQRIEKGCSGMAGAFGLTARNLETSLAMGAPLIEEMHAPRFQAGATECSSCSMQMEHDSPVPTLHPLKVLAFAYGLMPEIQERFSSLQKTQIES